MHNLVSLAVFLLLAVAAAVAGGMFIGGEFGFLYGQSTEDVGADDRWTFLAVTYDGTDSIDNLAFYWGDEETEELDGHELAQQGHGEADDDGEGIEDDTSSGGGDGGMHGFPGRPVLAPFLPVSPQEMDGIIHSHANHDGGKQGSGHIQPYPKQAHKAKKYQYGNRERYDPQKTGLQGAEYGCQQDKNDK